MKTVNGYELHFVAKRFDNGTLKNKRMLIARDHSGIPLFFESLDAVNIELENMRRIVVDMCFYAKPVKRKVPPSEPA